LFHVLKVHRESIERVELVGIDREKVTRAVVESVVSCEKEERRSVRRFLDDVRHHHFQLF
jgi:hypothetical protein